MNFKYLIILCLMALNLAYAQDDSKYINAMKNNISQLDTGSTSALYQELSNNFERIANAEKSKWLPYYYASYTKILSSFFTQDNAQKDLILDNADNLINMADSLSPKNSEIITLKAFSSEMRLSIDPMNRWMKYGQMFDKYIKEAISIDSTNPRPLMLKGQMVLYTPEQFGGGQKVAKPILEKSLSMYETFKPASEIHPIWGKEQINKILSQLK